MPTYKISQLTTATAVSATNQFEINQNGTSKSVEVSVIDAYIKSTSNLPVVVSVSSATDAVRITQTGTGNALLVEDSANPDSSPFVVDASGNVGIGTTTPTALLDVNGNVAITGTARRITGDFSNTTQTNRILFQSTTSGGGTSVGTIPNATGGNSAFNVFGSPDSANSSFAQLRAGSDTSDARLTSGITGTGTYYPFTFYTGGSERMRLDTSGNVGIGTSSPGSLLTVNGNLAFDSGYGSAAVAYGCRAWVNFNGTGTVAIRASGNVTSITDNGTGQYTMNFTTALPDANYCAAAASFVAGTAIIVRTISFATTSLSLNTTNSAASDVDASTVSIAIFR